MNPSAPIPQDSERLSTLSCIQLHGAFDARAARDVLALLQRQADAGHLELDFSKVSTFQDFALDLLVQGLGRLPGLHLKTRGIPSHPARVLQYLSIDPHTLAPMRRSLQCPACLPVSDHRDLDD
ncbi:STAS domain-containing protein [Archangium lipolyticum]|uniref:STAS domain-containing protein n=1 Tax=Archangium lipolyticum TaxID=2970465 RepID=UPI00214A4499|nr:STAS domain-containing protein [Archangium lipolyticum]